MDSISAGRLNMLPVPDGKDMSTAPHQFRVGPLCLAIS